jgi:hypothetical protein
MNVRRYDGPVKTVAEVRELWQADPQQLLLLAPTQPVSSSPANTYNLAEFSLWQTSPQNRFLVGPGRLSAAYTGMLRLLASPEQLAARVEQLPTAAGEQQQLMAAAEGVEVDEPAVAVSRAANTIRNYFMPAPSQQQQTQLR